MKNLVMTAVRNLVGAVDPSAAEGVNVDGLSNVGKAIEGTLYKVVKIVLPLIFSIITLIGVVYCIMLGVSFAKQESTDKREEAKKRLTGAVIGFGIAIIGSAALWALFGAGVFDGLFN